MNMRRSKGLQVALAFALVGVMVFGPSSIVSAKKSPSTTKKLSGKVLDVANKPLSGVSVVATPVANPASIITNTGKNNYSLTFNISSTPYTLTYAKTGYSTITQPLTVSSSTKSIPSVIMVAIPFEKSLTVKYTDYNHIQLDWAPAPGAMEYLVSSSDRNTFVGGTTSSTSYGTNISASQQTTDPHRYLRINAKISRPNTNPNYYYIYSNIIYLSDVVNPFSPPENTNVSTKPPTCTDGKLNGNETGVDTGGNCPAKTTNPPADTTPPPADTTPPPASGGTGTVSGTVDISIASGETATITLIGDSSSLSKSSDIQNDKHFSIGGLSSGKYIPIVLISSSSGGYRLYILPAGASTISVVNGQTSNININNLILFDKSVEFEITK